MDDPNSKQTATLEQRSAKQPIPPWLYNRLIKIANQAYAQMQKGRLHEAEALYRQVLSIDDNQLVWTYNLAIVCNMVGKRGEAVELFNKVVESEPENFSATFNLGYTLLLLGRLEAAEPCFVRAITLNAQSGDSHLFLGLVMLRSGQARRAIRSLRRALALLPERADAWFNLGCAYAATNALAQAETHFRRALEYQPGYVEAWNELGTLLAQQLRSDEAEGCFERARAAQSACPQESEVQPPDKSDDGSEIDPVQDATLDYLYVAQGVGEYLYAAETYNLILSQYPENAKLHNDAGQFFSRVGCFSKSVSCHDRAASLQPSLNIYRDNILFLKLLDPEIDNNTLFAGIMDSEKLANAINQPMVLRNERREEKTLRIAYVSTSLMLDMNAYYFMDPLFRFNESSMVENYVYGDSPLDANGQPRGPNPILPERFPSVRAWRDTSGLTPDEVGDLIQADGIDILVHVLGRAYNNDRSITFFHNKPAPIQVTFHGSMSSGLKVMDYFIADRWSVPGGTSEGFSERVIRLPRLFHLPPDTPAPIAAPSPVLSRGSFSFGFLGGNWKLNDWIIRIWSEILRQCPDSRLVIKGPALGSEWGRGILEERFARYGIGPERLTLLGFYRSIQGHLGVYAEVDLSLDPSPYCGGNSTLESLLLGVPVLTLSGQRFIGRMSEAILRTVGMDEYVAATPEEYIAKAVALARNPEPLVALRPVLRERLLVSPLTNGPRYARVLERLWRHLWRRWCAQTSPSNGGA